MIACQCRRQSTMCDVQGVLSKGYAAMPCLTSFDRVYCLRAIMSCHAWRRPSMCAVQGRWWNSTLDIGNFCVQYNGDNDMPWPMLSHCVLYNCYDDIPHLTIYGRVCCSRAMFECNAQRCLIVCVVQRLCKHTMPDFIWSFVLSKGHDDMPHLFEGATWEAYTDMRFRFPYLFSSWG